MRKPGQFVSICGKLARVCKHSSSIGVCGKCMLENGEKGKYYCFLSSCILDNNECSKKLGPNLYPKLICGNQDK